MNKQYPDNLAFFDLETRSACDLKRHSAARYARDQSTEVLCMGVWFPASELGPEYVGLWAPKDRLWAMPTAELKQAHAQLKITEERWMQWVQAGRKVCAHNASFDRGVLLHARHTLAIPTVDQVLCSMAQAESYSLPGSLDAGAAALKLPRAKQPGGKALIQEFCVATELEAWDPNPRRLQQLWTYCVQDVMTSRDLFYSCRQWSEKEWEDYHVLERVNDRGVLVDIDWARAAVKLGAQEIDALNAQLQELTGDPKMTVKASKRKAEWLDTQLAGSRFSGICLTTTGRPSASTTSLHKLSEALRDWSGEGLDSDVLAQVHEFIRLCNSAAGIASAKYAKMLDIACGSRLHDQFRCAPTITGRHAARGIQLDNFPRDALPKVPEAGVDDPADWAIEELMNGNSAEVARVFEELDPPLPFSQVMERLLRPTIIAPVGQSLVWGDWSAIEARVLAWVAEEDPYLEAFRRNEDLYCKLAVDIYGLSGTWQDLKAAVEDGSSVAKRQRLVGKVATLACGYQGWTGALQQMAAAYRLKLTDEEAVEIASGFREANPWLVRFWSNLFEAAMDAIETPGVEFRVGRVHYVRKGADLLCMLPDGRPITYADVGIGTKQHGGEYVPSITHRKMLGTNVLQGELYGGRLAENVTQGIATGSLLRDLLWELDTTGVGLEVIAPKHDEVLCVTRGDPREAADTLKELMEEPPEWAEGLPLAAECTFGSYYGK